MTIVRLVFLNYTDGQWQIYNQSMSILAADIWRIKLKWSKTKPEQNSQIPEKFLYSYIQNIHTGTEQIPEYA